jgi:type III pantothenate kinase
VANVTIIFICQNFHLNFCIDLQPMKDCRLILDWGNTALKAYVYEGSTVIQQHVFEGNDFNAVIQLAESLKPTIILLASVIHHPRNVELDLRRIAPTIVLTPGTPLPVRNTYRTPDSLGYDRLAAAIGAWQLSPEKPVLAVVAGTCITYNLIDGNKHFIGGAISPGLRMRMKSMHVFTAKLPEPDLHGEMPLIGFDTATSMRAGVVHGAAAEITCLYNEYLLHYPQLQLFLTGGDAPLLAGVLKNGIFARPNLIADGLNCIINYHVENHLI